MPSSTHKFCGAIAAIVHHSCRSRSVFFSQLMEVISSPSHVAGLATPSRIDDWIGDPMDGSHGWIHPEINDPTIQL